MDRLIAVVIIDIFEVQLQVRTRHRCRTVRPVATIRPVPGRRREGFLYRAGGRCTQQQAAEQDGGFGFTLAAADLGNRHPDLKRLIPDNTIGVIHNYLPVNA